MRECRSFDNKENGLRYADDTQATNNQNGRKENATLEPKKKKTKNRTENLKIAIFFCCNHI